MRRFFFPLFSFIVISRSSGSGAIDTDGDGIPDQNDQCPNTPVGAKTNELSICEKLNYFFKKVGYIISESGYGCNQKKLL
jgi:OOP family OmpA-OmpF porin